ncbi:MAG TPA: hypothetical protein VNY05_11820 [Candidatus Acidoferrales bacterium]|jgi:hypothetical protein|nr:hypothetical protein [Candidatus Acidoferrales bacterium]
MLIHYPDGSYVEGAIHRLEGDTMRAMVGGVDDAVEYRLIRNGWTSKKGVVVTFEFTKGRGPDLVEDAPARIGDGEARCAAGGDCALRRAPDSGAGVVQ